MVRLENSVTYRCKTKGVSDHHAVILEVDWEDTCIEPQVEWVVPLYNKTDVSGLRNFLRDKLVVFASNGRSVEEIWRDFKNILCESIESFVPHKIFRKISDPE